MASKCKDERNARASPRPLHHSIDPLHSRCTLPLRQIGAIPEGWRADGEGPGLEGERAAKPLIGLLALHHVAELNKDDRVKSKKT